MRKFKLFILLLNVVLLASCSFSIGGRDEESTNTDSTTDVNPGGSNGDDMTNVEDRWEGEIAINTELFKKAQKVRLSSFYTGADDKKEFYVNYFAPYNDTYTFKTNSNTTLELYSAKGVEIAKIAPSQTTAIKFLKDEIIHAVIKATSSSKAVAYDVTLDENNSLFPYDPQEMIDAEALLAQNKSTEKLSTTAAIEYVKREGGLYINCNNPEQITQQCLHKGLTRNDVSNKSVFFTFEHNNKAEYAVSQINGIFYYGYQVINRGTEDVYITVKNIGLHINGAGCWLGEKEWIDFYNTKFKVKGYNNYTQEQKNTFDIYYGFSNNYQDPNNQAITYRLPAGEYMYVMGGTTADAYKNINVLNTANIAVNNGVVQNNNVPVTGCSNGAVLFEVVGDNVEGVFYAYQDTAKISPSNKTLQGYVVNYTSQYPSDKHDYGNQYVGYDNCHGVVDAHFTWEFNSNTASGDLSVSFTNRYKSNVASQGTPYAEIGSTEHSYKGTHWVTHINPQQYNDAVGTDMTKYITVNSKGEQIVSDYDHYDGNGKLANIGNWMIDYMEHYTFVNHGNRRRIITVGFINSGSVAVLVRDKDGKLIEGTEQYTIVTKKASTVGGVYCAAVNDGFEYSVEVPANGYVQFVVEYNLLANAGGYVKHYAKLK